MSGTIEANLAWSRSITNTGESGSYSTIDSEIKLLLENCISAPLQYMYTSQSWREQSIHDLYKLLELDENWNSYGSPAINPRSVQKAINLIYCLSIEDIPQNPTISATPDGNATVCWYNDEFSLEIEIFPEGNCEYVYLDRQDENLDDEGDFYSIDSVTSLVLNKFE